MKKWSMFSLGLAVAFIALAISRPSQSQTYQDAPSAAKAYPQYTPAPARTFFSEKPATYSTPAQVSNSPYNPLQDLRQRYAELATQRSRIMTETELREGIQQASAALHENAADKQFSKIQGMLTELVKQFPNTAAAEKSRSVLAMLAAQSAGNTYSAAEALPADEDWSDPPETSVPQAGVPQGSNSTTVPLYDASPTGEVSSPQIDAQPLLPEPVEQTPSTYEAEPTQEPATNAIPVDPPSDSLKEGESTE